MTLSVGSLFIASRWPKLAFAIVFALLIVHLFNSMFEYKGFDSEKFSKGLFSESPWSPWSVSNSSLGHYTNYSGEAKDPDAEMNGFSDESRLLELQKEPEREGALLTKDYSTYFKAKPTSMPDPPPKLNWYNNSYFFYQSAAPPAPTASHVRTHKPQRPHTRTSVHRVAPTASIDVNEQIGEYDMKYYRPHRLSADTIDLFTGLDDSAHMIQHPDDFWDHFGAVLALEPVTLNQARSHCVWPEGVHPVFMYHSSTDWVQTDVADSKIDEARQEWQQFVRDGFFVRYEDYKDRFDGRGIVIVGGHKNTIRRIKLQLKMLRAFGSHLPVEIHHWEDEIDETEKWELTQLYPGLRTVDLSQRYNILETLAPFMNGYHMKVNAVLNSGFAEILLLDSDNIPLFDPAYLFESRTYKEYGTVFWPDVMRTWPNNPMWASTNTPCKMDEYEQESGQMLVDKRRYFYHLQLSSFLMKDPFSRTYLLGDKDMFRFAWHALKTPYGKPGRSVATIGTRLDRKDLDGADPFFCGRSFAQFHPDKENATIAFLHLNAMKQTYEQIMEYYIEREGGMFAWYKSPPDDIAQNWSSVIWAGHKGEELPMLAEDPARIPICVDFYDTPETPSDHVIPGFDEFFTQIGGYEILKTTVGR